MLHDQYRLILGALVAAAAAELAWRSVRRRAGDVMAVRALATAPPATLYLAYFATLELTGGIWWSIDLWLGAALLAGLTGLGVAEVASR